MARPPKQNFPGVTSALVFFDQKGNPHESAESAHQSNQFMQREALMLNKIRDVRKQIYFEVEFERSVLEGLSSEGEIALDEDEFDRRMDAVWVSTLLKLRKEILEMLSDPAPVKKKYKPRQKKNVEPSVEKDKQKPDSTEVKKEHENELEGLLEDLNEEE